MSEASDTNGRKSRSKTADDKAARLKAALKANLQRRKAQTRARAAGSEPPPGADDNEQR